ncbi:unnamed protein product, partial [Didymodactylos carnosus]
GSRGEKGDGDLSGLCGKADYDDHVYVISYYVKIKEK